MEEINDFYDTKNKIGDFLISHHYSNNTENKSHTDRVMETLHKIWGELDKYRKKHVKK